MTRIFELFATQADLFDLLGTVEAASARLYYVATGLLESPEPEVVESIYQIRDLGISETGKIALSPSFLVLPSADEIFVETVPQRRGGIRYSIDQDGNPTSVMVRIGGNYKDEAVISSRIGTIHEQNPESMALLKSYGLKIRRSFKKAGPYWLGSQAEKALRSGLRLTAAINAPVETDLSVEEIGKGSPISSIGRR